ncbi:33618_t:CDS:2, partial [Gigaspora margarita]
INLITWMHRITNEIIFRTTTGVKNNAVAAYYYTIFVPENIKSLNENEQEQMKSSEDLVQSIHNYMDGVGEAYNVNCIKSTVKFNGGSLMFWGCFGV